MTKPCAVFWDIENIDVPKGHTVASIVNLIRSAIIKPFNLEEIFFFCVCEHELPSYIGQSLTALDVNIIQAYYGDKDSADIKILDLIRKFVKFSGQDCTIIFLSDYADCYSTLSDDDNYDRTLSDLKKLHNVSIHLIRLANKTCSSNLDQIADYTFMLNDDVLKPVLKPVKSTGSPMYFISIKNFPLIFNINQLMDQLNTQTIGSIVNSAILYSKTICIVFLTGSREDCTKQNSVSNGTVQSTANICVLEEEMTKKLQYLFVITTNSEFKFTSGMISIIKLNLVQRDCPVCIEFEDKIWVAFDDLEKGKKVKARIDHIKFKMLHEYEDDFDVGVVMESIQKSPPEVTKMLANKLMNPKRSVRNVYLNSDAYPLGHFNYSYRKAVGMSISRYCQLNDSFK
uniref:NYN domain-containing protein n=1 Tax=Tetranychus urticae TaxID=32264 RepID=T1KGJ1_TETUR